MHRPSSQRTRGGGGGGLSWSRPRYGHWGVIHWFGGMLMLAFAAFRLLLLEESTSTINMRAVLQGEDHHSPPTTSQLLHTRRTDLQALYSKPTPSSMMFYIPEPLRSKGSGSIINSTAADFPFMPLADIYSIVQEYVKGMRNNFQELSRLIYQSALENNQILITLQIGGMDGISNDPMHAIFIDQEQLRLHNWFPIILEPVPTNFHKLSLNYADFQDKRGLPGTAIRQYAITSERDSGTCEFCHWNDTSTEQKCMEAPEWIRLQLGTLDCAHLENMMGEESSKMCVAHEDLPCGTVLELMHSLGLGTEHNAVGGTVTPGAGGDTVAPIGIVQIDVEGYEVFILQSMMNEFSEENLPLVFHFEKKVMMDQDNRQHAGRKVNGTKIATTYELLSRKGYIMYDDGEDVTAIRFYPTLQ